MDRNINFYLKNFLVPLALIAIIGVVMVYSSSYIYAKETMGSSVHFFIRQFGYLFLGIITILVMSHMKSEFWRKFGLYIHLFFAFLLVLTFIPGLGVSIKGSTRWISIGPIGLQPGEFIKYSTLLVAIGFFDRFNELDKKELITQGLVLLVPMAFIILQPDFGTFTICMANILFVAFMSTFPRKFFYGLTLTGIISAIAILLSAPYRVQRLLSYLDPWKDPQNTGFQIIQSYLAFANGQWFGQGVGNSNEKLFYLPEAHNDFIFSVIGEELGFVGVLVIVGLFLYSMFYGFKLAVHMKNRFAMLLLASIVFCIGLQSFLNMGVVLGILPTKGLNLPFISYGGSSLLANSMALGLFLCFVRSATLPFTQVRSSEG